MATTGRRQHRRGGHRNPAGQCRPGGGQRAAGGDEVVDEQDDPVRSRRGHRARERELARRGRRATGGAQPGGVRSARRRPEQKHRPGRRAGATQPEDGRPAQSLDVLTASGPGDGRIGQDRHEPDGRPRAGGAAVPAHRLQHDLRQHRRERTDEVAAAVLLVGDQGAAQRPVVGTGGDDRWQAGRTGVRPGRSRTAHGGATPDAERAAAAVTAGAPGRQEEVGEETDHGCDGRAPAAPVGRPDRQSVDDRSACGRSFGGVGPFRYSFLGERRRTGCERLECRRCCQPG